MLDPTTAADHRGRGHSRRSRDRVVTAAPMAVTAVDINIPIDVAITVRIYISVAAFIGPRSRDELSG